MSMYRTVDNRRGREQKQMMGKGRIHIYYGNGKGKTTAAVGQVVRAAGHGLKVSGIPVYEG